MRRFIVVMAVVMALATALTGCGPRSRDIPTVQLLDQEKTIHDPDVSEAV